MMQWLRNNTSIIAILAFAAFFRLYNIAGYMTFLGDEGRDAIVLYNILHGKLTLLGPTASVGGFFMGPAYYYLVAPFFGLFNMSPLGASVMVALLGIITVWLVYKIGSEFFDKKTGLLAAALYAFAPLVIIYSRSSWNPNVMPFFTLITLYILYQGIKRNKFYLFIVVGFLFGIDIQLHYVELFIGVVIILYVILMRWRLGEKKSLKSVFLAIVRDGVGIFVGFLLGFSPFLAFEFRHEFLNSKSIFSFIFASGETGASSNFFVQVWHIVIRIFGRLLVNFPLPNDFPRYTNVQLTVWYISSCVLALSSISYLFYLYKNAWKQKEKYMQMSLLVLWFCIGVLFFGLYKKNIYDYYFAFLYPVPFLLFSALCVAIFQNRIPLITFLPGFIRKAIVVMVVGAMMSIFIFFSPSKDAVNHQYETTKEIADFVLAKTEGKPFNFALITGGNSDHAYRYFFLREGKEPVVIQNSVVDPKRETVTDQLLVICDSLPCSPLGDPLWEVAGFGRAEIVGHWKVRYVEVYKLIHYKEKK